MMARGATLLLLVLCIGCTTESAPQEAPSDASNDPETRDDQSTPDDQRTPDDQGGADTPSDRPQDEGDARSPSPAPTRPTPGELTLYQLNLAAAPFLGEAGILVGPDGTLVLIDVGGAVHDRSVRDFVRRLNTEHLTPARGYARTRDSLEVDWIVLTHFHADHVGGLEDLLDGRDPLRVTQGIVHRGLTDIGRGLNERDYRYVCQALRSDFADRNFAMCASDEQAPCDPADLPHSFPATTCPGLLLGDLASPIDDDADQPSRIELGGGAQLTFIAASAFVSNGMRVVPFEAFGHDENGFENARSLAGVIRHGAFHAHFGGDMTGQGTSDDPDVESHFVRVARDAFYGEVGSDVTHVHHHARRSSSNTAFVAALAPADGRSRNAIAGISAGHIGSPHAETVDAWLGDGRLGEGRLWVTRSLSRVRDPALTIVDGDVVVQTVEEGRAYWVAGADGRAEALRFDSVRNP